MRPRIVFSLLLLSACSLAAEGQHPLNAEQQKLMELATTMKEKGDQDAAMVMWHQAAKASSGNTEPHILLAKRYLQNNNPQSAMDIMLDALKIQPLNPTLHNQYGLALDAAGKHTQAEAEYESALKLKPAFVVYQNNLAYSYIVNAQPEKAVALLEPLADKSETPPISRLNLALAYGMQGDEEKSRAMLARDLTPPEAEKNILAYRQYKAQPELLFKPQPLLEMPRAEDESPKPLIDQALEQVVTPQ